MLWGADLGCGGHFWGTYRSSKRCPVGAGLPGRFPSLGTALGDWPSQASLLEATATFLGRQCLLSGGRGLASPSVAAAAISPSRWGLLAVHQVSN